jgi:threonine dehydrogenase-like Zn-dependent dehydrogenase
METAVTVLWDARPHVGDRIAVIGAGTVGCLCAALAARVPGCRVQLVDRNPARASIATSLGTEFRTPEAADPDADLVIHASGSPEGLALALELAGPESVIVEASWFGDQTVPLSLGGAFHARRLTVRSSQVGTIPPAQRPRWETGRRMRLALELLQDARFDGLLTGESAFDALPQTMARLAAGGADTLCHVVAYE